MQSPGQTNGTVGNSNVDSQTEFMFRILAKEAPFRSHLLFDNGGKLVKYDLSEAIEKGTRKGRIERELEYIFVVENTLLPQFINDNVDQKTSHFYNDGEFFASIRALNDRFFMSSIFSGESAKRFTEQIDVDFPMKLTSREKEIVQHLFQGKSTAQISKDIGVTPHTVRQHLKSLFVKTDSHSQNQLLLNIAFAYM